MSIEYADPQVLKVHRTLIFPTTVRLLLIKDLKDLSVFFRSGYYRHAGPKGPEEVFLSFTFPRRRAADKRLPSPLSSNRENLANRENPAPVLYNLANPAHQKKLAINPHSMLLFCQP